MMMCSSLVVYAYLYSYNTGAAAVCASHIGPSYEYRVRHHLRYRYCSYLYSYGRCVRRRHVMLGMFGCFASFAAEL